MPKHYHFEVLASTQTYCQEKIEVLNDFDYVTSTYQTNGYGRSGLWDGLTENLYYSQVIPKVKLGNMLSIAVSVAIYKVVSSFTDEHYLKLPNDIYIGSKKLAGYIIEECNEHYIVGIGLNVNEQMTDSRLGLSLFKKGIDIKQIAKDLCKTLIDCLQMSDEQLLIKYKQITKLIGNKVTFQNRMTKEEFTDLVIDLDAEFYYFHTNKIKIEQLKILKIGQLKLTNI